MGLKEPKGSQVKEGKVTRAKEGKVSQAKKVAGDSIDRSGNSEALLELLRGENVTGLCKQLKVFVAPLIAVSGGGKENTSRTELHKLAKQFVPFLVRLLKLCFVNVGKVPDEEQAQSQSGGDEVFLAIEIALDGLDVLRSFITGSPFEIEIQRCSFVRRLLAWRRHSAALIQCRKNLSSICLNFSASAEKCSRKQVQAPGAAKVQKCAAITVTEKKKKQAGPNYVLPHPQDVELTLGLPTLVSGIVTDLIWCTGESAPTSVESYHELLALPGQLEPWLAVLDASAAVKQKDTLYKGLYKCVSILVTNPNRYGVQLVREFSMLTLQICAASSLWKQYVKVACKLSHCLSHNSASDIRLGLDVSQAAMKGSLENIELQGLWANTDMLELVSYYAHLCQTNKCSAEGSSFLGELVQQLFKLSPPVATVVGFYVIGLKFCCDVVDFDATCHNLLCDGAALLESCLQQESENDRRNHAFGSLKALEMVKKNSSKYIQGAWTSFISECKTETIVVSETGSIHSILRRVLHLWFLLLSRASVYWKLTREEDLILKQGWSLASAPLVSLLRLSLMSLQGVQDSVNCIDDLLKRGNLQIDELRWIIASAYNMGIQIYNKKDYEFACFPFRVAYDAAWVRVEVSRHLSLAQPTDIQVYDFILDSCIKCITLADSLKRSGKSQAGFETLSDGLLRWATIHSTLQPQPSNIPSSLAYTWVKTLHTEDSAILKSGTHVYECLYSFLETRCLALHHRTLGLLLEEELSVLHDLEIQGFDNIQFIMEQNLQSLLDNVYIVDDFPVERCRILLEKGRLARLKGNHDFESFSEVIAVLNKTLKDVTKKGIDSTQIANVENQLAMAYCAHAFCSYESEPSGQDYLESIFSALSVWEDSARGGRTWIGLDAHGEARILGQTASCGVSLLRLLLSVNDLMALKGYSLIQNRIQQLVVSLLSPVRMDSDSKLFSSLWANARLSHVLCPVPYPSGFFTLLTSKLGADCNALQFWEDCALLCPGSSLDAQLRLMHQRPHYGRRNTNIDKAAGCCQAFEVVEQIAISKLGTGPKSSGEVSKLAILFYMLAEHALDEGKLRVACKYAKESLKLRLRLVSRMFQTKYTGTVSTDSDSDNVEIEAAGQGKSKTGRLHVLDSVATRAWPKLSSHAKPVDFEPNPWRVLGDYVESLMQNGVISEKVGAVDDALARFSEGYSVSLTQNLPLARAAFKSCLGEVQRKRHNWEVAESELLLAKEAYENLETLWICNCCHRAGSAAVLYRLGDLARRCRQSGDPVSGGLIHHEDAMSSYISSRESLTAVLSKVNEGCDCSSCKYSASTALHGTSQIILTEDCLNTGVARRLEETLKCENENNKEHSSITPSVVGGKSVMMLENHKLSTDPSPASKQVEVDLSASLSNLKLTHKESNACDVKAPARRNSRRKPSDDAVPLEQKKLIEKRSTRSGKFKVTDKIELVASTEVAPVVNAVNTAKVVRKRLVKKSTIEDQKAILNDIFTIVEPEGHDHHANFTSNREELTSCVVRQASSESMDNWITYKWVNIFHQLLARVTVQMGKCYMEMGYPDKAVVVFQHASCLLNIQLDLVNPCADYTSYSFMNRSKSLFPIEEAAFFYHKSLFQLQMIQSSGSAGGVECVLPMNWLAHAYSLSTQAPPLLRKISRLLSILHVPITCGGLGLVHNLDCSMRERAAFFHQVSIGAGCRQQHLSVLDSKLLSLASETQQEPTHISSRKCFEEMQNALAVAPLDPLTQDLSVSKLVKGLPISTLCCISLVDREQAALLKRRESLSGSKPAKASVWVLSTRYCDTSGPISVILPANPLVDGEEHLSERPGSSASCPYDLDEPEPLKLPSTAINTGVIVNSRRHRYQSSLQEIASAFTSILDESRLSTSGNVDIETVEEKRQWWRWRLALDTRLLQLLESMENSWLGQWKCLLVAEPASSSNQENLQIRAEELVSWLKSSYGVLQKSGAHWNTYGALVRMLLQGLGSLTSDQVKEGISMLQKCMEAFLDQLQDSKTMAQNGRRSKRSITCGQDLSSEAMDRFCKAYINLVQSQESENPQHGEDTCAGISGSKRTRKAKKNISATFMVGCGGPSEARLDVRDLVGTARKSITLVLDSELQGLPWESLPVVRGFETYRMPSVASIRALFIHQQLISATVSCNSSTLDQTNEQAGLWVDRSVRKSTLEIPLSIVPISEPRVNPYNTYYVLNPSGDLAKTQEAFEVWFKENIGWEGKVGQVPTIDEYVAGLQKHDLYTYLGHGSGEQYLPERFVRRLDRCAASLLMGCSSGRFSPRGDYEPVGVPLSFLMAGCPAAIANLWDVTDGDIDRFSRFLLHKWLGTPNDVDSVTLERKVQDEAKQTMDVAGQHGSRKYSEIIETVTQRDQQTILAKSNCGERWSRMGSFIGEGRNICRLPYLIGASPVYYGIPTSIIRKEAH